MNEVNLVNYLLPMSSDISLIDNDTINGERMLNSLELLYTKTSAPAEPETKMHGSSPPKGPSLLRRICGELKKRPIILVPSQDTHWNQGCIDIRNFKSILASPVCPIQDSDEMRLTAMLNIKGNPVKICVLPLSQIVKFRDQDWEYVISVILTGADWEWNQIGGAFLDGKLRNNIKLWFIKESEASIPKFIQTESERINILNCGRDTTHASDFWMNMTEHLCSRYEADDNMDF
ncbi:hypothetical protein GNI_067330 [Gregarina niphandrodes]|uniref:Uncharacterized protein n=1 Tax=Gregarina niphandrodes TaxID=110365 RepID=A0A023B7Q7_GRENI|nr:hypothetical protein GNI_067330 [Gregarina niphandrodes]EZG67637.1 hypothetical protein GNI_067330 [Gregarina niphandrodes]|eukprot:XP_011130190.1 hypothetical protein GNI_067330 [Gregarina niphandrodes]